MLGWVRVLPLLAVAAASAVPPLPKVSWTLEDAVDFYNEGSATDCLYKPVETAPDTDLLPKNDSAGPQQLWFILQETKCLKRGNQSLEDCAFKEEGEMKVCSAVFIVDLERNAIVITCDHIPPRKTRFRRRSGKTRRPIRPSSFTNLQFRGRSG